MVPSRVSNNAWTEPQATSAMGGRDSGQSCRGKLEGKKKRARGKLLNLEKKNERKKKKERKKERERERERGREANEKKEERAHIGILHAYLPASTPSLKVTIDIYITPLWEEASTADEEQDR